MSDFILGKTCCFTGSRPQKLPWGSNEKSESCKKTKAKLQRAVLRTVENGYDCFICGMALGIDTIAAEIVLAVKQKFPEKNIRLICAVPCKNQAAGWNKNQKTRYGNILGQADEVIIISDEYTPYCMSARNKFMVENSSLVIAVGGQTPGGTKNTMDLAKEMGRDIIHIVP